MYPIILFTVLQLAFGFAKDERRVTSTRLIWGSSFLQGHKDGFIQEVLA